MIRETWFILSSFRTGNWCDFVLELAKGIQNYQGMDFILVQSFPFLLLIGGSSSIVFLKWEFYFFFTVWQLLAVSNNYVLWIFFFYFMQRKEGLKLSCLLGVCEIEIQIMKSSPFKLILKKVKKRKHHKWKLELSERVGIRKKKVLFSSHGG